MGIMGKWASFNAAYLLYKFTDNKIYFGVSSNGTTMVSINDDNDNFEEEQWLFIVGRYTPGAELALFINGNWYKETAGIPAFLFDSAQDFEIGRYSGGNYLNGKVAHAFVCAYSVPDRFIEAMYAHTRALFKSKKLGVYA